ncbi:hypothetical protein NAEGRDRAFT_82053 [Naegleria gruberi]|uniref:Uncharacterized protein n=1 Tax=Naegleria gruberi TaxID=5762 RepID=D2W1X3_NAEGR|nr:uncharacterized protein NAEGRDRAFT_82053 [Naegleria gruberi]EFC36941.1 hypothetical protein NAEGRDRAFT_82053 [Naegleria gruberi]|eukprot:XP_002669685.1 hypothetical protein NAEGRDRAFT_82053 [Naegleria gruberi strain NEG-M]
MHSKRTFLLACCFALMLCCQLWAAFVHAQQLDETSTSKTSQASRSTIREFILDPTTRQVIDQMKIAVSSEQEVEIAENFVLIAAKLREIYETIPKERFDESEIIQLREELLELIQFFTRKANRPSVDMMKYSLIQSATERYVNETQKKKDLSKNSEESDAEWITAALNIASSVMNIANDIGTYHEKISKVGNFIANQVSNGLDKVGLKKASGWAKDLGNGISKFSNEKIAPIENKIAKKIAPVVKSAPFQAVRRTLNVVTGVMSLKSGLNLLGMAKNVKLPKNFSALKSSIKTTTKAAKSLFKNKQARSRFSRIAKLTGKRAYRTFKKADLKTKYKTVKSLYGGAKSIKGALTFKRNERKPRQSNRRNNQNNRSRQYGRNRRNQNGRRNNRSNGRQRNNSRSTNNNRRGGRRGGNRGGRSVNRNNQRRNNNRSRGGQGRRNNGSRRGGNRGNTSRNSPRRHNTGGRSRQSNNNRRRSNSRPSYGNRGGRSSYRNSSPRRSSPSRGYSRGGGSRSSSRGGGRS